MTIKARKFTPEVLLSAPRRSRGIPNSDASLVLYNVSTYSFREHKKSTAVRLLDTQSNKSSVVSETPGEVHWLGDHHVLQLTEGEDGITELWIGEPGNFGETKYKAGTIDGSPSDSVVKRLGKAAFVIAFGAPTTPDGELYNSKKAPKKHTSGRVYDSLFVRHWDHYVSPEQNSIWYGTLDKTDSGSYELSPLTNALKETELVSPIDGSTGSSVNFDISQHGLAFVAKDSKLNPANNTKQDLYLALRTSRSPLKYGHVQRVELPGFEGATSYPRFSPDGKSVAVLSMRQNGYEADKNHIVVVTDIDNPAKSTQCLFGTRNMNGDWDRSPNSLSWSNNGEELYITAEHQGRNALFATYLTLPYSVSTPRLLFDEGSISDVKPLHKGDLFISCSSLVDDSIYYVLDLSIVQFYKEISSHSKSGSLFGLSRSQIDEFYYDGAQALIQAWIVKPSNFDPSKKYPLAYLIHGGPQGAWNDSWSTRWNPAVFAEQGYVVVTPNPTGSTGFGQDLTDAIQMQWGGLPYEDLVKGIEYIENNLDYVDMDRAVALGASFGGYMVNWIQGHDLGRKFKALVTHDGVFSMTGQLASEELWFPEREFGGKYWDAKDKWLEWDPSRFTGKWSTPHLIIHSEKDYRLTISEGLSAFNVLQERGVKSRFLVFPDENHWVLQPENSLLWHTVVFDWINEAVGLPKYGNKGYPAQLLKEANMESGRRP